MGGRFIFMVITVVETVSEVSQRTSVAVTWVIEVNLLGLMSRVMLISFSPTTLRLLIVLFRSYLCLIGPFNYISLYEGLPQPWYNHLWLTGLNAPTNWCLFPWVGTENVERVLGHDVGPRVPFTLPATQSPPQPPTASSLLIRFAVTVCDCLSVCGFVSFMCTFFFLSC